MHVVILLNTGILGAHEIFLSSALFSASLVLANVSDQCMHDAERGQDGVRRATCMALCDAVNTEKAFIFLSFFAKGILTLALVLPFLFADKMQFKVAPASCQTMPL